MDIILRGGQIIDGTGAKAVRADLGVQGDTIAAIGDLSSAQAAQVIDVTGLMVAPGFIDMHSHSDSTLIVDPTADSKVRMGVTTEVVGQCGGSPAPIPVDSKEEFDRYWMGRSAYAFRRPDLYWSTFGEFLDVLRDGGLLLNIIPLVGHGAIHSHVMASREDEPSAEELQRMRELVKAAMGNGAWGMSTGLIYAPGNHTSTAELVELSKVVAESSGYYFSHIRNEGAHLLEAIEEVITISRSAKLPAQIAHYKAAGRNNWQNAEPGLRLIERAQDEGLDVTADIYPYIASSTGLNSTVLPLWARGAGSANLFAKPLDRQLRQRLLGEIAPSIENGGRRWDEIFIARCEANTAFEGLNIAQIAEQKGVEPAETALRVLEESKGKASVVAVGMSEDNLRMGLAHPTMMIGTDGSDLKPSGPLGVGKMHPRSYGTFPRVLGYYARVGGLFSLETGVHKMTGLTAKKLGLKDRGRLATGYKADITVINPSTVIDTATFADPYNYPIGVDYVFVNGKMVVDHDRTVQSFAGKVLTR